MAHQTVKSGYRQLVERLNRFPQGAPPSSLLYQILKMLFSEKEAELISALPVRPFTAKRAARVWKVREREARTILEKLASRAILLDMAHKGQWQYVLPPPMAGFFEFSMMRLRGDVNQKALAELFYQYLNVEDDFVKNLFTDGQTQLGRVLVHEPALPDSIHARVYDYERASQIIRDASAIGISICYCRHKMAHLDRACDAPRDICMTFNTAAQSLIRNGFARQVDVPEGLDLLALAYENSLVQFGDNVREGVNFICNCCGCCCEAMLAAKRFGMLHPVHTTNFIPRLDEQKCIGCGKCVSTCPVEAMSLISANDPHQPKRKKARLDTDQCLGCGVCVRHCPQEAITIVPRKERVLTPVNSVHRTVRMAVERGKLQNLIFDNHLLLSHRAMAALLGAILKLPPVQQAMASKQMNSRYLEALCRYWNL